MDARLLTRCTNVALVVVAGMGAGHLLTPARADAGTGSRVAFTGIVAATGAISAARERSIAREYGVAPRGTSALWLAVGAASALALAAVAWYVVHG